MDSNLNYGANNEYPLHFYIHLFFVFVGFLIYLTAIILFQIFFEKLSLIKEEIFTFIIINSFKSLLEILLSSSIKKEIIIYLIGIIEFYLIIRYINKCLTTSKLTENSQQFELEYRYFIILGFIISSFPYEKTLQLQGKYVFSYDTISIILSILFFRYVNIKMQLLLDYLKEKKMQISEPDIYLHYLKAQYFFTQFNIVNTIFYSILFFVITYNIIKILNLFFEWESLSIYLNLIFEEAIYCSIISGCLILFYSLNVYNVKIPDKRRNEIEDNSHVIEVEIQQDDNTNYSKRKKKDKKKKINNSDNVDENNDNNEKENTISKIPEETEKLK